jgi:hypothetical protein
MEPANSGIRAIEVDVGEPDGLAAGNDALAEEPHNQDLEADAPAGISPQAVNPHASYGVTLSEAKKLSVSEAAEVAVERSGQHNAPEWISCWFEYPFRIFDDNGRALPGMWNLMILSVRV